MVDNQTVKERLLLYIKYLGIGQKKFEEKCGLSNGYINNSKGHFGAAKIDDILNACPDLDRIWLMTGKGNMLLSDEEQNCTVPIELSTPISDNEYRLIPLFNIDSVGGMHSHNDVTPDMAQYIETYVPFHLAHDGDIAIKETGDSMIPTIPPGSIMQLRRVETWQDYIGYGNIFVILLNDGRRITKEIRRYDQDPANYYWCVSHNPEVADEELPKKLITEVWKVLKILTDRGW